MPKELVKKARDGDIIALNTLIDNHKELAFSIALKYLKNRDDAEDVVQNSFIIVLKAIKNFRNEAKFSTWLYKIVYHECLRELKSRNETVGYLPQFLRIESQETPNEETIIIEVLLKTLKPVEYSVITLFYLKEKSIEEIAKITSLSKANIKVLLHRARLKMRQAFNEKKV